MLQSLQIRNYVLIDSLDVDFPEGLVIITGQTGAGKSILLGALTLLLGTKTDASILGNRAENCVVEALFKVPADDSTLKGLVSGNETDWNEGELILRRVVSPSGRSRAFVNDSPVTLQSLQEITSHLVDIHTQHQTLLLNDPGFQLSLLDHFAGNEALLLDCEGSFRTLKALETEVADIRGRLSRLAEERAYNEARFQKLEEARLQEGELESLEAEQRQLANAEEIKNNLGAVEELMNPSDPEAGGMSISSALKEAQRALEKAGKFIPLPASLTGRLESARIELDDILEEVSNLNARTELNQARLERVEERMTLLYDLLRQFGAASEGDLIAQRDALSELLFDSTALEDRLAELEKQVSSERKRLSDLSEQLHDAREQAREPFAQTVIKRLRNLELEHAVFEVAIREAAISATGSDRVQFLFSASGGVPVDVARCASGGEMSRLMLCLKAMMAKFMNMPTLIFDEIDSGVSGSAADKMGEMICAMGKDMQIFAITHLPQVAAKGDAHYLVEKEFDVLSTTATTTIRPIQGQDRVREIARMLSGSQITPEAIANARSLLR
jgi:DNA repair protein RecN (Recombination protein N)